MVKNTLQVPKAPIASLKPHPANSRQHPDAQIQVLVGLLKRFGWMRPILVDKHDQIIAGHGIVMAAKALGETEVPVLRLDHLKPDELRAYLIADNQSGQLSLWDRTILAPELLALRASGFDLEGLGFDEDALTDLLGDDKPPESNAPDEEPEQPPAVTEPGDLWLLGNHALICGDSTSPKVLAKLMAHERAALIHTDPPYGVSYQARSGKHQAIEGDDKRGDDLANNLLLPALRAALKHCRENAAAYVWHASSTADAFRHAMRQAGLVESAIIIWVKRQIVLGWGHYRWQHEPCFYAMRDGTTPEWYGGRDQSTVWRVELRERDRVAASIGRGLVITDGQGHRLWVSTEVPDRAKTREVRLEQGQRLEIDESDASSTVWEVGRDDGERIHPTAKPVALCRRAIENSTAKGEIVINSFGGSGSTLIACELTGRKARIVELDPAYCDRILARWAALTGREPKLSTGEGMAAIAKARGKPTPKAPAATRGIKGAGGKPKPKAKRGA